MNPKRILFTLAILFATLAGPRIAEAGWGYAYYRDGRYVRCVDGQLWVNDGLYYRCSYNCGYPSYSVWETIDVAPAYTAPATNSTITYSNTWKERMVDAMSAKSDTELFIQAAQQSGLTPVNGSASAYANSGGPYANAYAGPYASSGYSIFNQGYAQTGSTVYGSGAYSSGQYAYDANAARQQRLTLRGRDHELQAVDDAHSDAQLERGIELAKLQAIIAGNLAAAGVATQTAPVQQSSGWQANPVPVPQGQQFTPPANGAGSGGNAQPPAVPPNPTPDQSGGQPQSTNGPVAIAQAGVNVPLPIASTANPPPANVPPISPPQAHPAAPHSIGAITVVMTDAAISRECSKCHQGQSAKGNLDLVAWKSLTAQARAVLYDKPAGLRERLLSAPSAKGHMPPAAEHQPSADEVAAILAAFAPASP